MFFSYSVILLRPNQLCAKAEFREIPSYYWIKDKQDCKAATGFTGSAKTAHAKTMYFFVFSLLCSTV